MYYKDKVTDRICLECKRYGDVSRILEGKSRYGLYEYCELGCGYKKTLKKFLTKAQKFAEKFPVNKELRKAKLKEMRESRKSVSFQGIQVTL